jgi:hypothetical protein
MSKNEFVARMNEVIKSKGAKAETSGEFIRYLIVKGGMTDDEILKANKAKFKDSAAGKSDCSWNRGALKAAGMKFVKPARAKAAPKATEKAAAKAAPKGKAKGETAA